VVQLAPALTDSEPYDEFAPVAENAAEKGVAWPGRHLPRREHDSVCSSIGRR
jgi:hypothetical protein